MTTTESLPEGLVGNANYSNRQYETFKLKERDDSFQFRPLPPMKSLIKRRDFGLFWKTHFGWKGLDERGKERQRPFLCVEEKRDGRLVHTCAACTQRNEYRDKEMALVGKKKGIEAKGLELKKSPAEIRKALASTEAELKEVRDWLYGHGLDGKFRLPCINRQGKVGIFMMPYGLLKKFRERCRELNQKGIDPCGVTNGVWFEATRSGQASPTSDDCQSVTIDNGDGSFKIDRHTFTTPELIQANEVLPDLVELSEKGRITDAQITALVNCSGDPEEVDAILGTEKRREQAPADEAPVDESKVKPAEVGDDAFGEPDPKPAKAAAKSETKVEEKQAPAPAEEPAAEEDEDAKALAELQAKMAAKKAAAAKAKTAAPAETKVETKSTTADISAAVAGDAEFENLFD